MAENKQVIDEAQELEEALSPIVNRLIDKNFEDSQDKIAIQIAPLIGVAIKEQIKSQRDDIVDALYPIMGNMISKFVTKSLEDMFSKINAQIQNGLSAAAIKRKIKAKIQGVSETELLLQENSSANIKSILLIHKESGILLTKVEKDSQGINEADMLASMMTAIRSFVNDWITQDNSYQELGEIEYGGNKIIIEASGHSYLAIIVEGAAYAKTYEAISTVFSTLVSQYGEAIQAFDGDVKQLPIKQINRLLETLLVDETQLDKEKKKVHPLLIVVPLFFVGWFLFNAYQNYIDEKLKEDVVQKLSSLPQLALYKIDTQVEDKILTLSGNVPYVYYKKLAEESLKNAEGIMGITNNIVVLPTLSDPMQASSQIAYYIKGLQISKDIHLTYSFDFTTLTIEGFVGSNKLKQEIINELKKIEGIKYIKNKIEVAEPQIDTVIYFTKGSTSLDSVSQQKLTEVWYKLHDSNALGTILLHAYSDQIGSVAQNRALAKKRIAAIENFLKQDKKFTNKIKAKIFDSYFPAADKTNPEKSRCVQILYQREKI